MNKDELMRGQCWQSSADIQGSLGAGHYYYSLHEHLPMQVRIYPTFYWKISNPPSSFFLSAPRWQGSELSGITLGLAVRQPLWLASPGASGARQSPERFPIPFQAGGGRSHDKLLFLPFVVCPFAFLLFVFLSYCDDDSKNLSTTFDSVSHTTDSCKQIT